MSTLSVLSGADFGASDPKLELAIEERRKIEAERLSRIKDVKTRTMGIDTSALAAQVQEKMAMQETEAARNKMYDEQRLLQDQQLAYLEQQRLKLEKQNLKNIETFRKEQQGVQHSREYDLNDPKGKWNDQPARVGDSDPRLSVSGMQQFHGEDLSYASRVKAQQEELRQWNDEAIRMKAAMKAEEAAAEAAFAERALQIDSIKSKLEDTSRAARTATNVAVADYQLAQAAAKRERERVAQLSELQDNIEEIQNNMAGDMLTENPIVGRSFLAPNRVRSDHYKGMAPEERTAILMEQEAQRAAKDKHFAEEKAIDAAADAQMEHMRRMGCYSEAQVAAKRAELRKKVMEENQTLAEEQFATKSFLVKNVYTNSIEPSFFDQFGTSSR